MTEVSLTPVEQLAGVLFVLGFYPYLLALLVHKRVPESKTTWIIWAVVDWTLLFGMLAQGILNGIIIGACIGASSVAITTVYMAKKQKQGNFRWSPVERNVLLIACAGLVIGLLVEQPRWSIIITTLVLLWGSRPMICSAIKDPSKESKPAWTLFFFSCVFTLIGLPEWNFEQVVATMSFVVPDTLMFYYVVCKPWAMRLLMWA